GNVSSTENRPPPSVTIFVVPLALWASAVASASARVNPLKTIGSPTGHPQLPAIGRLLRRATWSNLGNGTTRAQVSSVCKPNLPAKPGDRSGGPAGNVVWAAIYRNCYVFQFAWS